ncbi:MAG: DUF488 domain-containing protein [Xanthobacteraceae bacterium]
MQSFDLFSIGHSNIPAERFVAMLRRAGVSTIVDVRSTPSSRRFPWFSSKNLARSLQDDGILYMPFGDALGGRPRDPTLYRDGIADYDKMAQQPEFCAGLDRLLTVATQRRVCLMCAEREPLDCHRCLLVSRALAERGCTVGHILHDGTIEPHTAIEQRLLADSGPDADLFVTGQGERLAAAYRSRCRAVAYRVTAGSKGASSATHDPEGRTPTFGKDHAQVKRTGAR